MGFFGWLDKGISNVARLGRKAINKGQRFGHKVSGKIRKGSKWLGSLKHVGGYLKPLEKFGNKLAGVLDVGIDSVGGKIINTIDTVEGVKDSLYSGDFVGAYKGVQRAKTEARDVMKKGYEAVENVKNMRGDIENVVGGYKNQAQNVKYKIAGYKNQAYDAVDNVKKMRGEIRNVAGDYKNLAYDARGRIRNMF